MQDHQKGKQPKEEGVVWVGVNAVWKRDEGHRVHRHRRDDDQREIQQARHGPGGGKSGKQGSGGHGAAGVAGQLGQFEKHVVDVVAQEDHGAHAHKAVRFGARGGGARGGAAWC